MEFSHLHVQPRLSCRRSELLFPGSLCPVPGAVWAWGWCHRPLLSYWKFTEQSCSLLFINIYEKHIFSPGVHGPGKQTLFFGAEPRPRGLPPLPGIGWRSHCCLRAAPLPDSALVSAGARQLPWPLGECTGGISEAVCPPTAQCPPGPCPGVAPVPCDLETARTTCALQFLWQLPGPGPCCGECGGCRD